MPNPLAFQQNYSCYDGPSESGIFSPLDEPLLTSYLRKFHSLSLQEPAQTSVISTDYNGSENALTNQAGLEDESTDCNTYLMARLMLLNPVSI